MNIGVLLGVNCRLSVGCVGWDINSANLAEACERAAVLDVQIQDALQPQLVKMRPRPSIYCPDFIAANQEDRANNTLRGRQEREMFYLH